MKRLVVVTNVASYCNNCRKAYICILGKGLEYYENNYCCIACFAKRELINPTVTDILKDRKSKKFKDKKKCNKRQLHSDKRKIFRKTRQSDFYMSDEWIAMRYNVIKTYGRECMACGATKGSMHVDHIKSRSRYPDLELVFDNLQVLCKNCNMGKRAVDDTDFRLINKDKLAEIQMNNKKKRLNPMEVLVDRTEMHNLAGTILE